MSRIVWVTSFPKEFYEPSGSKLIESFLSSESEGTLHVYPENMLDTPLSGTPGRVIIESDLSQNRDLATWLTANAHVIPKDLGGRWIGPCRCAGRRRISPNDRRHRPACPGAWFNRYSSKWFRKVLAVRDAGLRYGGPLIWLDSDTRFQQKVTAVDVDKLFCGTDLFFLKGPKRAEPECGIYGLRGLGLEMPQRMYTRYRAGAHRRDARWDDCAQFHIVLKASQDIKSIDLAVGASGHADVVPHSPLAPFFTHSKGRHGRILGIRK